MEEELVIWFGILAASFPNGASVSLGLSRRHAVSRSLNCTVPQGKGVLRGDRGLQGGSVRRERENVLKNARRYATFIKVVGPEGEHEIGAP